MKILCPIDFSDASVHAAKWITSYLGRLDGGNVEFLHCINLRSRAGMFMKMDDILTEWAQRDMMDLVEEISKENKACEIDTKIVVLDPKSFIPDYASSGDFDWIVVGTKGLTSLKDITVGSVTEHLINKSAVPVLAVPDVSKMEGLQNVILGIDKQCSHDNAAFKMVADLCIQNGALLRVVHFRERTGSEDLATPAYFSSVKGLRWQYEQIDAFGDLIGVFNSYCEKHNADLLCMIHQKRNWWQRIFSKSLTKSELFGLAVPLFVITNSKSRG